jgi:hypothetical protein
MKIGLGQANGMLKRLKNVDRPGGPVDIVFNMADNLQKYHYQVNSIWVF